MVSKPNKLITSLQQKYRIAIKCFFAEGISDSGVIIVNFELVHLYTTQNDFEKVSNDKKTVIEEGDLKK
jgi:TrmH family RNA methyltransferase